MGALTLLASGWCWLLPAAALPIVFHFAYRQRRKQLRMPSLLFFQRLEPRLQARKRLRDLLVLLLRALALLVVVLALARPLWQGIGGGGPAAIILVVDNSASMGAPTSVADGSTRLAAALEAAAAVVANLGARDRAGVVLT
nr:BatA domain-containing protein [Planctomycetota bacterium]